MFSSINFIFWRIKNSFKRSFSIASLVGEQYLSSKGTLFVSLLYPLMSVGIMGSLFAKDPNATINTVISGLLVSTVSNIGFSSLSLRLTQWRQTTLIKRIGATPIAKWEFLTGYLLFYILLIAFEILWLFAGALAMFPAKLELNLMNIQILPALVLTIILSVAVGILISSISFDANTVSVISFVIRFPSSFLSGQYIPLTQIDTIHTLSVISKLWPERYLVEWLYVGFGATKPDPTFGTSGYVPWVMDSLSKTLALVYPLSVSIIAIGISAKLYKWG